MVRQAHHKRNPLHPATLLPRTGNPYIDGLLEQGLQRAGAVLLEQLPPGVQRMVGEINGAMAQSETAHPEPVEGRTMQNPSGPVGDKGRFMRELAGLHDGLFLALGRRGSGKTALCLKLAQMYHNQDRPVYVIGIPQAALNGFGFRALEPEALSKLPNGCVLVIDDVALFFSNRDYAKAGTLHEAIIASRHRDIILIMNAHNSALIDKYLMEATAVFLKPASSMTDDLQRSGLRMLVARSNAAFKGMRPAEYRGKVYAASDDLNFEGMLEFTPPRGWSERVSKHRSLPAGRRLAGASRQSR